MHYSIPKVSIYCHFVLLLSICAVVLIISGCHITDKAALGLWTQINPDQTIAGKGYHNNSTITDIQIVDSNYIVAVGTKGMFHRSSNFGRTWLNITTSKSFRTVHFLTRDTGFAAGFSKAIYRTYDGGVTWENCLFFQTNPVHEPVGRFAFIGIHFINSDSGFALSRNGVYWTFNGGDDWQWNQGHKDFSAMDILNDSSGIACSYTSNGSGVYTCDAYFINPRKINTVSGWTKITDSLKSSLNTLNGYFTAVSFINDSTIYATIQGFNRHAGFIYSSDSGKHWDVHPLSRFNGIDCDTLKDLSFSTENDGIIVGPRGWALRFNGSFSSPVLTQTNTNLSFSCADYAFTSRVAIGGSGNTILTSRDTSRTWNGKRSVTAEHILNIRAIDSSSIIATTHWGTVLVSNDNGKTWIPHNPVRKYLLNDAVIWSDTNFISVGLHGIIIYTKNGGRKWHMAETPYQFQPSEPELNLYGVDCFTSTNAVAVGNRRLLLSEDGGAKWQLHEGLDTCYLRDVYCLNSDEAVAVGHRGVILRTSDRGASWSKIETGITDNLTSVYFVDSTHGWAAGWGPGLEYVAYHDAYVTFDRSTAADSCVVLSTSDGGFTWVRQSCKDTLPLESIYFSDLNHGIAVGGYHLNSQYNNNRRIIMVTHDGGEHWKKIESPRHEELTGVTGYGNRVYISGGRGFIAFTDSISSL